MTDPQQPGYVPSTPPPAYQPAGAYNAPVADNPGKTLGIVAFVLSFFVNLVGLILGIVALSQSRKVGQKNGFAVAAIVISSISIVIGIIVAIALIVAAGAAADLARQAVEACSAVDYTGTVTVNGITVDCSSVSR